MCCKWESPLSGVPSAEKGDHRIVERSYFDGGLLQLIGWKILGFLVTVFTLGICYPWAVCMLYNWEVKHTVINGRRLRFNGTAPQLFGSWILWWFLSLITLGIYKLWADINVKKWITKHTEFADMSIPTAPGNPAVNVEPATQFVENTSGSEPAYIALLVIGLALSAAGILIVLFRSWWGYAAVIAGIAALFAAGEQ